MTPPLRVLIVEDNEDDALLVQRELRRGGRETVCERVDTAAAMARALAAPNWDLVISDYAMPGFSGLAALDLLKASGLDLPFIIVSGTIGEEVAVGAMKAGAHDYVMKGNLARLLPAVERELRDAEVRRNRRHAEDELLRLHADLERRVEERTRELAQANEALRLSEARYRQAAKHKDEFMAMLAHELRNPLAPIRSAVQVLRLTGTDGAASQRQQDVIDRQVGHMGRLLDDLLDLSRIARGKVRLQMEQLDLRTVLDHCVDVSRNFAQAREHKLTYARPAEPILVEGDFTRLEQIVINLLNNAIKYTEPGGLIGIRLERASAVPPGAPRAILRIQDSGIGIAPDLLPSIFELFTQADHSRERSQGGLGIGLSMVKNLVELHGGHVEVFSPGLGLGSEFVVTLPLAAASAPAAADEVAGTNGNGTPAPSALASSPADAAGGGQCGVKILIVDDHVDSAYSLGELLTIWGHQVQVATDGPQAIELAQAGTPDIIFLDIGLPGMDGYQVARHLRRQASLDRTLLVALTGYGQEEDRRTAEAAGFNHHCTKPIDLQALRAMLNLRSGGIP